MFLYKRVCIVMCDQTSSVNKNSYFFDKTCLHDEKSANNFQNRKFISVRHIWLRGNLMRVQKFVSLFFFIIYALAFVALPISLNSNLI